jgi:hypothetical protein
VGGERDRVSILAQLENVSWRSLARRSEAMAMARYFYRRNASEIRPHCFEIGILYIFQVEPWHRRQDIAPVGLSLMLARPSHPYEHLLTPFADTRFVVGG